jgi:hypothetical protein
LRAYIPVTITFLYQYPSAMKASNLGTPGRSLFKV